VKARQALANVARSAALAAMAAVIVASLHAGVEPVFAVLRGMLAFLVVQWLLGAAADLVELAAFKGARPPAEAPDSPARPHQRSATQGEE